MTHTHFALAAVLVLANCTTLTPVTRDQPPQLYTPPRAAPVDAAEGTCWDKTETPALVKTVTEDVLVQPAQISSTGTLQSLPVYRSQTRQVILQERQIRWFQILCDADLTPDYVASVQRALALRNLYKGEVNGKMSPQTRAAIKAFQKEQAVSAADHATLTVEGARKLGLWAQERDTA